MSFSQVIKYFQLQQTVRLHSSAAMSLLDSCKDGAVGRVREDGVRTGCHGRPVCVGSGQEDMDSGGKMEREESI